MFKIAISIGVNSQEVYIVKIRKDGMIMVIKNKTLKKFTNKDQFHKK